MIKDIIMRYLAGANVTEEIRQGNSAGAGDSSRELAPVVGPGSLAAGESNLPYIVRRSGSAAVFAAEEFFFGTIRNDHTRRAYLTAVNQFLAWAEARGLELVRIAPRDVGQYLTGLGKTTSIATRKQHLAALRHFFDGMVTRHAIMLNPALSVRGERYAVVVARWHLAMHDGTHPTGIFTLVLHRTDGWHIITDHSP